MNTQLIHGGILALQFKAWKEKLPHESSVFENKLYHILI